jgi:hypothetical protein
VPDGICDEDAAQSFINPVSCVGLVDSLRIPRREYLLQTAAGAAPHVHVSDQQIYRVFANSFESACLFLVHRHDSLSVCLSICFSKHLLGCALLVCSCAFERIKQTNSQTWLFMAFEHLQSRGEHR